MHLKIKIVAIISSLLLGVSIAGSLFNYFTDLKSAQDQLQNTSLPLSVDNIYTEIQQRMIEPLLVSSLMAQDTFMRDWLLSGEKDATPIVRYLNEIQKKYDVFTTFLVSDITKNYYQPKGLVDVVNVNNVADNWYFNFKKQSETYEVNLDYNIHLGDALVMFINYKVMDYNQKLIGATGVGVRLLNIEEMLNSFKEKYKYDVYFVDNKGEIMLFSKKLNKRGNIAHIEGLKTLKEDIFANKTSQYEYENKDGEYFLNTKYIDKLKLHLLVEINKKEYIDDLRKTFYINLIASLIITLLVTAIIIYTINIYQKQLVQLASEDALTGLANRRKFNEYFERVYKLYHKSIKTITLILIDIDDFKNVNDTLGHLTGDQALTRVAQILKSHLRTTDMVARWGGEEFSILLLDVSKEDAIKIAHAINSAIKEDQELFELINKPLTISLGLGELTHAESQDGLVYKVDKALYKAKNEGKDQLVIV
ncbi:MAG: GGDEF domain-containing protein [Campylobacteraceae bacterium]|nr:GGDEF domain-containing protein [Campylobacteraceae bacterium]